MTTIVTRAGKGSALTFAEGDANINNLNTAKLENIVEDTTPQLGGNLDVNGNSIVSTSNANIVIEPNGTGDVQLNADTIRVGDSGAAATITSNGAGNLTLNTNAGTNSGTITINQGANQNITFTPNGSGLTVASGGFLGTHTPASAGGSPIIGRSATTVANSIRFNSINVQKHRTDLTLASMTNEPAVIVYSVRDSASTNRNFASNRAVYQGTGTNPFFAFDVSTDGFTTTVACLNFGGGQANWGSSGSYTHSTTGTTDLILNTNNGTNSGSITINDGANANIALAPNGTGRVAISNPLRLASFTAAALTALTGAVGDIAAVTDSAGGGHPNGMIAFWDTTNARWSYVHDNSAV